MSHCSFVMAQLFLSRLSKKGAFHIIAFSQSHCFSDYRYRPLVIWNFHPLPYPIKVTYAKTCVFFFLFEKDYIKYLGCSKI